MKLTSPAYFLTICLITTSCTEKGRKSPQLVEANRLHLEAMKISRQLEHQLDSLSTNAGSSAGKLRIDSLKKLVEVWEENVIEVPGFAHAHDHTHGGHSHEHKPAPQMTDESMLDYQRQSREAIVELRTSVEKMKAENRSTK